MLLVTRRRDETIRLYTSDGVITVLVAAVFEGRATIGIDAPACVVVHRDDIKQTTARGVHPAEPAKAGDAPLPLASAGGV